MYCVKCDKCERILGPGEDFHSITTFMRKVIGTLSDAETENKRTRIDYQICNPCMRAMFSVAKRS